MNEAGYIEVSNGLIHDPFGMLLVGRNWDVGIGYRYGFNGKENEDEIAGNNNDLDFGARIYDARLAKWLSIDPLQKKYPSWGSYTFATNNPINLADKDGRDTFRIHFEEITTDYDEDIVLVRLTFSVIINNVETKLATPPLMDGDNNQVATDSYYLMMPRSYFIANNRDPRATYDIKWLPMNEHPSWSNTIWIQGPPDLRRNQYAHPGLSSSWSEGCWIFSGYPTKEEPYGITKYYSSPDFGFTMGNMISSSIKNMYDQAAQNNSLSSPMGFQLKPNSRATNSRTVGSTAKIAPVISSNLGNNSETPLAKSSINLSRDGKIPSK